MDLSNIAALASQGSQGSQQIQGHHHRHMSMSQRIDKMESAIDQAVKNGKLTDDQATAMKKELDDVKNALASAKSSGTPLTDDQRTQIHQEMQDVGKQLFSAINPSQGTGPVAPKGTDDLFSKIDANGDGKIDKDELSAFVNQMQNNGGADGGLFNPSAYNQQGSLTISVMQQSTWSITA